MATAANIKSALSYPADADNPLDVSERTVGNLALARFQSALEREYPTLGTATADDAARWLRKQARDFVRASERRVAENAIPDADEFEEVV